MLSMFRNYEIKPAEFLFFLFMIIEIISGLKFISDLGQIGQYVSVITDAFFIITCFILLIIVGKHVNFYDYKIVQPQSEKKQ